MRIISALSLIILLTNPAYSQTLGYHIYYLGSLDINNISGNVEFEIIKKSGGNWVGVNIGSIIPQNFSSLFNNQSITYYNVSSSPNYNSINSSFYSFNNLWETVSVTGSLNSCEEYKENYS